MIDKNIYIWELFAGRRFLTGYSRVGRERKGDKLFAFLLELVVPRRQTDRWVPFIEISTFLGGRSVRGFR